MPHDDGRPYPHDDTTTMRRSDLIAALQQHRDLQVVVAFDGARLPILGVRYAAQEPNGACSDDLEIKVGNRSGLYQVAFRYEPGDDDDLLPEMVMSLREMWDDYRQSSRGRSGHAPDFYTWASTVLRTLYNRGFLTVPLPADVNPDGPCKCARTPAPHLPRQHPNCIYRREITA